MMMKIIQDNMKRKVLIIYFIVIQALNCFAQNPSPASDSTMRILYLGGTAHIGNGKVIESAAIGIANGKLTFVMDGRGFKPSKVAFDTIIDISGKHIYPGIIAMNTTLGINEIEAVRATIDSREVGDVNPSSRAIIAYNTDSKVTPTVRSNGVLMAQIAPQGGLISGSSSVVKLDAWNYEDAAYLLDEGIWMQFPTQLIYKSRRADSEEEQTKRAMKKMAELSKLFDEAQAYSKQASPAPVNPNFEAMKGLFNGSKKLYVKCEFVKDILSAIQFTKLYGVKMVLVGGGDAWRVTSQLAEEKIPVLIMRTHSLPRRDDDDIDLPYKLPTLLKNAGVEVAITDDGFWQNRNIPFQAGTAVAYGLTKEQALECITLAPARILGIDKNSGSLEDGKDATFIISSGDILDTKSCNVEQAFIQGKEISLDNIQKQLYLKYMKKYNFQIK
jgi:imidazolonepropionase-like amidohydrolase